MNPNKREYGLFSHGSAWARADFHLHTREDTEFSYKGEDSYYHFKYVEALQKADIRIGVISNHNKFSKEEFKELKKTADKKEIFLLPGVELSVSDGAKGIHVIVVFSDEWIENENNNDYINTFMNNAFHNQTPEERCRKNSRSDLSLVEMMGALEKHHKDFFLVFAHVEDDCGLWKELSGGRLTDLGKNDLFKKRTLAFQKVRTYNDGSGEQKNKHNVMNWLGRFYPAEVEGSDPKSVEEIGKGRKTYLKIGAFTFEAVKYALLDHANRVKSQPEEYHHAHIQSISFEGGVLNGQTVCFSPELNTLIGIRGSGKSSVLEALRYVLDIPFGEKSLDKRYKEDLTGHVLGSGGKATVHAVGCDGCNYEIRRIYREPSEVFANGELVPGVSIRETIFRNPIYFGQKDLSSTGEGFEKDFVLKLIGEQLVDVQNRIESQKQRVKQVLADLARLEKSEEKRAEYEDKKKDAEYRLKFYKENGVEEKLQEIADFDTDSRKCVHVIQTVKSCLDDLTTLINTHEDNLRNQRSYHSRQNQSFFNGFFDAYDRFLSGFNLLKTALSDGNAHLSGLKKMAAEFEAKKSSLKESFAEIGRKLEEELKTSGAGTIRMEEFRELRKTIEISQEILGSLDKQSERRKTLETDLLRELSALSGLWREEFGAVSGILEKINKEKKSLTIRAEFKGDKEAFKGYMKDIFRGSGVRETTFKSLADDYQDFGAIYKDLENAAAKAGSLAHSFRELFVGNLSDLLTWQVPNRFTIEYRGKELGRHSLGQRASALILFILNQRENHVALIDQPEDDLDNQTIYEDVIKLLLDLKCKTQFIFATHNANFPVLGDAEQVISCTYENGSMQTSSGGVDDPRMQTKIVKIMEGGNDAFNKRKRIYETWKLPNC